MKISTGKLLVASAAAFAFGGLAQASVWDGGGVDNEFTTALNWDDDLVQVGGNTTTVSGAFTVERTLDSITGRFFVEDGAIININGGNHSNNNSGSGTRDFLGRGSEGTINMTAGTYNVGHMLSIGGGNANGDGTFIQTGGDFIASRGSNSLIDGTNPFGRPSLEVGDSTGLGSAFYEISGGSLATRGGVGVGSQGVFSVVGSSATSIGVGSNQSGDGSWIQDGGELSFAIDAGGVTKILIDDVGTGVDGVDFRTGSTLDLSFTGIAPVAGTWTIFEVENFAVADWTGTNLALAAGVDSNWSFAILDDGANSIITATYVPEPGSMALVGVGALAMIRRRSAK